MSVMNVVDSSVWLEYLADTPRAVMFASVIEDPENVIVPTIVLVEVIKIVRRERGEEVAVQVAEAMKLARIVDLDSALALDASRLKLPLADSIIYATTIKHNATLWTQDEHLRDLPNVNYFPKTSS